MAGAQPKLQVELAKAKLLPPAVPVISNVTAQPHGGAAEISARLVIGTWTFVAAVFNSETNLGKIYINGELDNTDSITKEFLQSSDAPVIGTNHWAPGDGNWAPVNGLEDEVRLYNRTLSDQEIFALYKQEWGMLDISIDVKPGEYPNMINPSSPGKLGVAILASEQFNASDVDPESIELLGASPVLWTMEDVDRDGDTDLLLNFSIPDMNFDLLVDESIYRYAYLHGQLKKGTLIEGRDTVVIIGPLMEHLLMMLKKDLPHIRSLRDVSVPEFNRFASELPEEVAKRARHVVEEIERSMQAESLLQSGNVRQFGELMNQCHASLRDLYEVSCPELDAMVEVAQSLEGCYGARLTGAGFGGCTVNLVAQESAGTFARELAQGYKTRTRLRPDIYITRASNGAELLK